MTTRGGTAARRSGGQATRPCSSAEEGSGTRVHQLPDSVSGAGLRSLAEPMVQDTRAWRLRRSAESVGADQQIALPRRAVIEAEPEGAVLRFRLINRASGTPPAG